MADRTNLRISIFNEEYSGQVFNLIPMTRRASPIPNEEVETHVPRYNSRRYQQSNLVLTARRANSMPN